MPNNVQIWNPPGGGSNWPLVSDGGVDGIEANGGRSAGSDQLLKVYGQVFEGSLDVTDPACPKKPWPWHGANATLSEDNNGNEWTFSLSENNIIPVPNPTDEALYTLIVWGDFDYDRCYDIAKAEFTLTIGSGAEASSAGGGPFPQQAFRVAPRQYRLWTDLETIDPADAGDGWPAGLPVAHAPIVLDYDDPRGTRSDMAWRTAGAAIGGLPWALRVTAQGDRLRAELTMPQQNGRRSDTPLRWTAPKWDSFARNRLYCREAGPAGLPTAFLVEPL